MLFIITAKLANLVRICTRNDKEIQTLYDVRALVGDAQSPRTDLKRPKMVISEWTYDVFEVI
jgi:hypothetical protein